MPGRLLFKEKQLRLCVVAALSSIAAPVAESLVLPPKPLASNISWSCQSGISNDWLCNGISRQSYKFKSKLQYAEDSRQSSFGLNQPSGKAYTEAYQSLPVDPAKSESLVSLLDSPGNHYVLQWMAAKERGQLEALKQRYPVLKDATIAQYKRSGKIWYVLLDGPYPSRIAALAELDSPPRSDMAQELYPWTRSMASIQKLDIVQPEYPSQQLADAYQQEYRQEYQAKAPARKNNTSVNYDIFYSPEQNKYQNTDDSRQLQKQQRVTEANRQNNHATDQESHNQTYNQRQPTVPETLPYGSEFNSDAYSSFENEQNYQVLPEQSSPQEMYVSITPAYRSTIPQQHVPKEADYNIQNMHVTEPSGSGYRERPNDKASGPSQSLMNVLTANPENYTIEWMNGSRKASLERAKLRYSELENTQIIHYKKNSRNRYALVSMLFVNRSDALDALLTPSLSRISARFSPKVRQVAYLQSLVGSNPQTSHAWTKPGIEPSIHKRQWLRQDDPDKKTYIVSRQPDTSLQYSQKLTSHKHRQQIAQSVETKGNHQPEQGIQQVQSYTKADTGSQINALFDSPDNNYTIQWFSSNNRQSIERLKQRFPELASAVTVHVKRNQKDWYVLVQGQYKNSQEAIMALKSPAMKNIAMILHPWTRPLESLKKLQIASL